jgi:hypothetical protein
MRTRAAERSLSPEDIVDLNSDPALGAERQAEVRQLLHGAFGPLADAVLRACGQTAAARRELAALRAEMERMTAGTQLRGIVTAVHDGRVRVLLGGTERELPRPDGLGVGVGQTVLTDAEGRTVLSAGDFLVGGQTYAFCELLEGRQALVRPLREGPSDDARQVAVIADCVELETLAPGDRVLGWSIDWGNVVLVTRRLGLVRPAVADEAGVARAVTRADIVGLDDVLERVERLFLEPPSAAYAALLGEADRGCVGAVFNGRPGCGKSLVAELVVGEVRRRGGKALYRTASHYLSKWVGEGAATLRADFALLDAAHAETGVRPLLVVDELEAIALDRTHPWTLAGGHLDVLDTLLGLLTRSRARMIGISNLADRFLDTALVRDGRLPIIRFPPTLGPEEVVALVGKCLARVPLAEAA